MSGGVSGEEFTEDDVLFGSVEEAGWWGVVEVGESGEDAESEGLHGGGEGALGGGA